MTHLMKLFIKDHPHVCEYCAWADRSPREAMLCYYRGPVASDYRCRKFRYDPYKRIPNRQPPIKPLTLRDDPDAETTAAKIQDTTGKTFI